MEKLLKEKDEKYIKDLFSSKLESEVELVLFLQSEGGDKVTKFNSQYLPYTEEILKELVSLSDKLTLTVYKDDKEKEEEYGVEQISALFVEGKNTNKNVIYYGIPSGHEFSSLLEDIIDASRGTTELSDKTKAELKRITSPTEILVFVTPSCPYCPRAVRTAHQMAMENNNIKGVMIEANEFPEWSQKYSVYAVPKVVINDNVQFEGALPEDAYLENVLKGAGKIILE
ncbi:MAG: thioredoxin family protein [Caldisericaceae bacterium]|nr:thioredoxin family protein [Caldisericaceae bacterium]